MAYVLGLDLGTGSIKGLLVDPKGNIAATATAQYPLLTEKMGYSEQEPYLWLEGANEVIESILRDVPQAKDSLEGISFSGQMHSLVLLDGENKVIRNAILWNDVRTTRQREAIMEKMGEEYTRIIKNHPLEGFTLPKLLWVKEKEPENYKKIETFLLPKDYLRFYLTGDKGMDYSDGAGTVMMDIEKQAWSDEVLAAFEIDKGICPKLVASAAQTGILKQDLKEKFGFSKDVKVFAGGADNPCGALGAGILDEKTDLCSIGTSGVYLSYEKKLHHTYHGELHFFNHVVDQRAYAMGSTLSAGNSLNWFRKTFFPGIPYEELLKDINQVPPGSNGLLFTPYIMGERTPYPDSAIRGSFTGIDVSHGKDHFLKAVLEGITFSLKDCQQILKKISKREPEKIVSVGGGAKNPLWLQMQADIFGYPVITLDKEEGPAFGAAMIAAVGLGWYPTFEDCAKAFVKYNQSYYPDKQRVTKYQEVYEHYKKVYPALKKM